MIATALQSIGLSSAHQKVYLQLLESGSLFMTEIARLTGLKRSTVYLLVEDIIEKGLISEVRVKKRKQYTAAHPEKLLEIVRYQEKQVAESLPELLALYNFPKDKPKIQVFEGEKGMRLIYKDIFRSLEKGNEMLFFTDPRCIYEYYPELVSDFTSAVLKLGNVKVRELQYPSAEARQWVKDTRGIFGQGYQMRFLPDDFAFGACDNVIYENKLIIFSLKEKLFAIIIESEEISKTYKAMFEWAWSCGKDVKL